jgi:hypothetical protein
MCMYGVQDAFAFETTMSNDIGVGRTDQEVPICFSTHVVCL